MQSLAIYPARCFGKFHALGYRERSSSPFGNIYDCLWKELILREEVGLNREVLHATDALHAFRVTCNASESRAIFSEVVSFDFPVEGHAVYTQHAGCLSFVPGGFVQGFKNCVRIERSEWFIGSARLDSGSAQEVRRQMIEGDDVLGAQDEGMLHGVLELPHIAGPGIF